MVSSVHSFAEIRANAHYGRGPAATPFFPTIRNSRGRGHRDDATRGNADISDTTARVAILIRPRAITVTILIRRSPGSGQAFEAASLRLRAGLRLTRRQGDFQRRSVGRYYI